MIIITGLGRCGTSFLTSLFKNLNFGVGRTLRYHEEYKAGMELAPAYAISRDMFTDYICQRDDNNVEIYTGEVPLDLKVSDDYWEGEVSFREKILRLDNDTPPSRKEGVVEVIKRILVLLGILKIIRAWWEVRKDIKLIILHRRPEEVNQIQGIGW